MISKPTLRWKKVKELAQEHASLSRPPVVRYHRRSKHIIKAPVKAMDHGTYAKRQTVFE